MVKFSIVTSIIIGIASIILLQVTKRYEFWFLVGLPVILFVIGGQYCGWDWQRSIWFGEKPGRRPVSFLLKVVFVFITLLGFGFFTAAVITLFTSSP